MVEPVARIGSGGPILVPDGAPAPGEHFVQPALRRLGNAAEDVTADTCRHLRSLKLAERHRGAQTVLAGRSRTRSELEVALVHEPEGALDAPAQPRADRAVRLPPLPGDCLRTPDRQGDPGMRQPGQLAVERNEKLAIPVPVPRPSGGTRGWTNLQRSPARA